MTQSFDEWFEKNGELYREPTSDERYLFEAGAQSRQAEVDGLAIKLDGANERAMSLLNHKNRMVDKMQAEIDALNALSEMSEQKIDDLVLGNVELQKRIDTALERSGHAHIGYPMLYKQFVDVINILKGTINEL